MLNFTELTVNLNIKKPLQFQHSPEIIGNMLKKAGNIEEEKYVFSNLGKAGNDGYFRGKGSFKLRSLDNVLIEDFAENLKDYEDDYFKVNFIMASHKPFEKIKSLYSLNPVFLKMENGMFWTFNSSGNIEEFVNLLQEDLLDKFELYFEEKLNIKETFVKFLNFKNEKPFTYIKDGKKCFGYKIYIEPKEDETSQILAFIAVSNGLGHLNEEVGGGFSNILG